MNLHRFHTKHWNLQHLLVLLVICILAYWPLSFGIFSAKNDNIVQFLPVRFHVSEALRNGYLPLWTPYMYLGYPIHGDMQGGAWNPIVYFLSLFSRYDVTLLHAEILIALFIGASGMYRLAAVITSQSTARIIAGVAYMLCGFATDSAGSNLPFLWGAAYSPFVMAYYYQLLVSPGAANATKTAIAFSLLLVSAYPAFFILTCYIVFAAFLFVLARKVFAKKSIEKDWIKFQGLAVGLFIGLSAIAIYCYLHVLPFYQRGEGVSVAQSLVNSFHPSCTISLIFPSLSINLPDVKLTDLMSRNLYLNIFLFLSACSYAWIKKSAFLNFVLIGTVFFYLFSLGSYIPVREMVYHFLPLMDTFRHPANARLYVIIGGIVMGVALMDHWFGKKEVFRPVQVISKIFLAASLMVTIVAAIQSSLPGRSLLTSVFSSRQSLKDFLEALKPFDHLLLNGIVQCLCLVGFLLLLRKRNWKGLGILIILNSFLLSQFAMSYTLASKRPPVEINKLLKSYPAGYPIPDLSTTVAQASEDVLKDFDTIGISGFYSKKITVTDVDFTPTFLTATETLLQDSIQKEKVLKYPIAYITPDSIVRNLQITRFWNNGIELRYNVPESGTLHLQQVFLPGWSCTVDGVVVPIKNDNIALMAVQAPAGTHMVRFRYQPPALWAVLIATLLSMLVTIYILLKRKKN